MLPRSIHPDLSKGKQSHVRCLFELWYKLSNYILFGSDSWPSEGNPLYLLNIQYIRLVKASFSSITTMENSIHIKSCLKHQMHKYLICWLDVCILYITYNLHNTYILYITYYALHIIYYMLYITCDILYIIY